MEIVCGVAKVGESSLDTFAARISFLVTLFLLLLYADCSARACKIAMVNFLLAMSSNFFLKFVFWGQFHQPYGAERKCVGSHSLAPVGAVQFHQQNYAQLHHYAHLENTFNSMPWAARK
jgi:hypothetical protein